MNPRIPWIIPASLSAILVLAACDGGGKPSKPPVRVGEEVRKVVGEKIGSVASPVTLQVYRGGELERQGSETQALVEAIAQASPSVKVVQIELDETSMAELEVDRGPVVEMRGHAAGTLRYYGFPERKEVPPFLDGILLAAGKPARLSTATNTFLAGLEKEVVIRIFTSPE